jgi:hypothetical protein
MEKVIFEDYENTSNYFYMKRPPVPVTPSIPLEDKFLTETIKESTIIKGNGRSREAELSPKAIRISILDNSMPNTKNRGEYFVQSHGPC